MAEAATIRVDVRNFITVGIIATIWLVLVKWAVNAWAPNYSQYI